MVRADSVDNVQLPETSFGLGPLEQQLEPSWQSMMLSSSSAIIYRWAYRDCDHGQQLDAKHHSTMAACRRLCAVAVNGEKNGVHF